VNIRAFLAATRLREKIPPAVFSIADEMIE
jgi:hypothetical protein